MVQLLRLVILDHKSYFYFFVPFIIDLTQCVTSIPSHAALSRFRAQLGIEDYYYLKFTCLDMSL